MRPGPDAFSQTTSETAGAADRTTSGADLRSPPSPGEAARGGENVAEMAEMADDFSAGHAAEARAALFAFLDAHAIAHRTVEHPRVFRVEEGLEIKAALPGGHTKNLFLKDAKDRLWLVCALGETRVDLKKLPAAIGSARLSFGSAELMTEVLGVEPGSVTVFALLNDPEQRVSLVLDKALTLADPVNFHPLSNDATTAVSQAGLQAFLRALNRTAPVIDFSGEAPLRCGSAPPGPS